MSRAALDLATKIAAAGDGQRKASVRVFSTARIYGSALGLPTPGLLPTRKEWEEQRGLVEKAVLTLKKRGLRAQGQVVATRNPTRYIVRYAKANFCDVIVMTADPPRHPLLADFIWSQEAYRVERRSPVPVYLVDAVPSNAAAAKPGRLLREARLP